MENEIIEEAVEVTVNEEVKCSHCEGDERKTERNEKMKKSLVQRLNKIEGQIRGIKGMIDRDVYCDDVLNQIAAAQSAMRAVGKLLLENHVKSCFVDRIKNGENEVVDELLVTIDKLSR